MAVSCKVLQSTPRRDWPVLLSYARIPTLEGVMVRQYRKKGLCFLGLSMFLLVAGSASAQIPVQIIHDSPDPAVAVVDIYVDAVQVLDDFVYKMASPFVDEFGVPVILVTPTSLIEVKTSDSMTVLHSETLALTMGAYTLIEVIGLLDPMAFDPNPDGLDTSLDLLIYEGYKPAADDPITAELMAVHAAPDLGTVDIVVRVQIDQPGVGPALFSGLQYGDTQPYLVLTPSNQTLDLVESGTSNVIRSWAARFGLVVGAGVVGNAAGLLNPPVPESALTLLGVVATGFVFELNPTSMTNVADTPYASFSLGSNYPNPFNPSTTIPFTLFDEQAISLKVYDLQGRLVRVLVDGKLAAGDHAIPFYAQALSSGRYVYELRTPAGSQMESMTLLK